MKQNMGTIDRIVRILIVLGVVVLYAGGFVAGGTAVLLGFVAVLAGLTAIVGFCPVYYPFKISTKKATGAA